MSTERDGPSEDLSLASNAGGVGGSDGSDSTVVKTRESDDLDPWSIQGDYLVRTHKVPRTTLFSPLDVPADPPPIDVNNIEVLRVSKPRFAGEQWPKFETIDDSWSGNPSDAKSLHNPVSGATLTDWRDIIRKSSS